MTQEQFDKLKPYVTKIDVLTNIDINSITVSEFVAKYCTQTYLIPDDKIDLTSTPTSTDTAVTEAPKKSKTRKSAKDNVATNAPNEDSNTIEDSPLDH